LDFFFCEFIGPTEYSIDAMGDKITSKKIAIGAGVRVALGREFRTFFLCDKGRGRGPWQIG
jgi:biotin carboxylase